VGPVPLVPVERLVVDVLVDNVTDNLSSAPSFVESEFAGLSRRRGDEWMVAGDCLCCAAHGLSCLLTVERDGERRQLLFDAGPEDRVFEQNASRLGLDLGGVEAMVLSHGHWDHGGGMLRALQLVRDRNGGRRIPYFTHPDMFRQRAMRMPGGVRRLADVPDRDTLDAFGADVVDTRECALALDGQVFVSGEIPRVTDFERGMPGQLRRTPDGGWEPDELLADERFVAVHVDGRGLVVFSACSHAGIVNVVLHALDLFPGVPLLAVIGGLHLAGPNEAIIPDTVAALRALDPGSVCAGHCTGWRAVNALAGAFGEERIVPLAVGRRLTF
jgi:7,8-dihydropterin-6-yl-methyl-4-(beta-D-ribofuranosyl)aminobenzene 5'-phosphate synthase